METSLFVSGALGVVVLILIFLLIGSFNQLVTRCFR